MALTARALIGLAYAAKVAGVDLAAYQESVLERDGQHFADLADTALATKKLAALEAAKDTDTKSVIVAAASSTAVIKG